MTCGPFDSKLAGIINRHSLPSSSKIAARVDETGKPTVPSISLRSVGLMVAQGEVSVIHTLPESAYPLLFASVRPPRFAPPCTTYVSTTFLKLI